MTDCARSSSQRSFRDSRPRSRKYAFDKALLTGRVSDNAHQDLFWRYTTAPAVEDLAPSRLQRVE